MRELVMDTETTGFEPTEGHRIVEIGVVELVNLMPTGNTYHQYINPERPMPKEAFDVHGLGDEFLRDKPVFKHIVQDFLAFIGDDRLVIHNASFDMRFINAELGWLNLPPLPDDRAFDTLSLARKKFPGSPASLDALCRRFSIDNSSRTLHGALLDSEILAEVYLELLGGQQPDFGLSSSSGSASANQSRQPLPKRATPLPPRLSEDERTAHAAFVQAMGDGAIWRKYGG
ncbi:DNA polymerase III subunit epsilon [Roseinatronobacter sp. S2]|uniref:DNA polymerase III subunit epsilon n=1 Tax=Roseinatronobacter sp. S2 TaxID=3035471 RepID=UPI00240F99F8|nr:DNA polymerase III subunit epsilon [Roseinatronobacter sp. S2]WFE75145.1 DNA polymerase III subunit epsilon [Roseinatronobacter sp. S2]